MTAYEDVWLAELKKTTTKYAEVKAIDMVRHLRKTARGTHKVDILELQDQIRELNLKGDYIPEYIEIEATEKAQEQSEHADNKVSDATMVNIATKAMLSTERFPKTNIDWEDLSKTERT